MLCTILKPKWHEVFLKFYPHWISDVYLVVEYCKVNRSTFEQFEFILLHAWKYILYEMSFEWNVSS